MNGMRQGGSSRLGVVLVLAAAALVVTGQLLFGARGSRSHAGADGWSFDLAAALVEARETGRPVVVDFRADWCPPCRQMEETTFLDGRVRARLAEEAIAVRVDVDEQGELARRYRIRSIPTIVVLEPDGRERLRSSGYLDADAFLALLSR